jgi:hypothetical protein
MVIMEGLSPPEFAIIHAIEQSKDLVFDRTQIQCYFLPGQFLHIYHPQDGRVRWVNDKNWKLYNHKKCFIKMVGTTTCCQTEASFQNKPAHVT